MLSISRGGICLALSVYRTSIAGCASTTFPFSILIELRECEGITLVLLRVVGKVLLILTLEIRFVFFMMDLSPNNQIEDRKPILTADGLVQTSNSPFEPTISQETQTSNGIGGQCHLTVDQLDIEILPIIYDIVRW